MTQRDEAATERKGLFARLQEDRWPYILLAVAIAIAAYIIGYGVTNGG
jgi:hypothetical protein